MLEWFFLFCTERQTISILFQNLALITTNIRYSELSLDPLIDILHTNMVRFSFLETNAFIKNSTCVLYYETKHGEWGCTPSNVILGGSIGKSMTIGGLKADEIMQSLQQHKDIFHCLVANCICMQLNRPRSTVCPKKPIYLQTINTTSAGAGASDSRGSSYLH